MSGIVCCTELLFTVIVTSKGGNGALKNDGGCDASTADHTRRRSISCALNRVASLGSEPMSRLQICSVVPPTPP